MVMHLSTSDLLWRPNSTQTKHKCVTRLVSGYPKHITLDLYLGQNNVCLDKGTLSILKALTFKLSQLMLLA